MRAHSRVTTSLLALFGGALLIAGCASSLDPAPVGETSGPTTGPTSPGAADLELDAAWLDQGRMVAVVTWGSSTCVPTVDDVTAEGQTVRVALVEGDPDDPCTADYTARASLVTLPSGVDPTRDLDLVVTLGDATDDTELDGNRRLTGVPGETTDFQPSAGWFDDDALVLLTWGSSTCLPVIDTVDPSGDSATVAFVTEDRPCTMDMVPRATIIDFGNLDHPDDDEFTLTLVGGGLDATLTVVDG